MKPLLPGCGSKISRMADRTGNGLSKMLKGQPLDKVAQFLYMEQGFGEAWVRNFIITELEREHKATPRPPSQAHGLIPQISWRTIFTTNYDRLVELGYDATPEAVHRILPIYEPDPQIHRHDADVVHLIKLNGSVDEAARNSHHKLVVTFADQQQARSQHAAFYDLLRQEAIVGPVIFAGFRFVHPGAYAPGSSPELDVLRQILLDMGPAAWWHYYVSPFDPDDPSTKLNLAFLESNRIHAINGTLGEFLNTLATLSIRPIPITTRQNIKVPVGKTHFTIDAETHSRDARHFETLGDYIERVEPPPVADSLNGKDNWGSHWRNHGIKRGCEDVMLEIIESMIGRSPEILIFSAPPGWGKTFLLKKAAISVYRSNRPVIWLNPYGTVEFEEKSKKVLVGNWDTPRIDNLIGQLNARSATLEGVPVIIADNCAERCAELLSLYNALASNGRKFVLIFAVREQEYESLEKSQGIFRRVRKLEPKQLFDSTQEVRDLIEYCEMNDVGTFTNREEKEIVLQRIVTDEADKVLILALQVIFDRQHRPFTKIVSDFWTSLLSESARELVLRIATIHRFGSLFVPRLYAILNTFAAHERYKIIDEYKQCLGMGTLLESVQEGEPCVATLHSLVAEHLLRLSGYDSETVDKELLNVLTHMSANDRDLELIRRLLKRVTDYEIHLASEGLHDSLFKTAAETTNDDWVVCQQYAKYLLNKYEFEPALFWADRALKKNPDHAPLLHTKGNVLRRWGIAVDTEKGDSEAKPYFDKARDLFAASRIRRDPDEYGYVTHLDMLIYLMDKTTLNGERANLQAEGIELFREGIKSVPQDRYNYLLEERFQTSFDIDGQAIDELCESIRTAIENKQASDRSVAFLARQMVGKLQTAEAIILLREHLKAARTPAFIWIVQAELLAKSGDYIEAHRAADSARRMMSDANPEIQWRVLYWSFLISIALGDFKLARDLSGKMAAGNFNVRQGFPRGYFWKASAKDMASEKRSLRADGWMWTGRVEQIRAGRTYGEIRLTDASGEALFIRFNPRYFGRTDFRRGDSIKVVLAILQGRVRADDPEGTAFTQTIDDLFLK